AAGRGGEPAVVDRRRGVAAALRACVTKTESRRRGGSCVRRSGRDGECGGRPPRRTSQSNRPSRMRPRTREPAGRGGWPSTRLGRRARQAGTGRRGAGRTWDRRGAVPDGTAGRGDPSYLAGLRIVRGQGVAA